MSNLNDGGSSRRIDVCTWMMRTSESINLYDGIDIPVASDRGRDGVCSSSLVGLLLCGDS